MYIFILLCRFIFTCLSICSYTSEAPWGTLLNYKTCCTFRYSHSCTYNYVYVNVIVFKNRSISFIQYMAPGPQQYCCGSSHIRPPTSPYFWGKHHIRLSRNPSPRETAAHAHQRTLFLGHGPLWQSYTAYSSGKGPRSPTNTLFLGN